MDSDRMVIIIQGRDVHLRAEPADVRHQLFEAERPDVFVRFKLYDGRGDVLVNPEQVGAIFVPSEEGEDAS